MGDQDVSWADPRDDLERVDRKIRVKENGNTVEKVVKVFRVGEIFFETDKKNLDKNDMSALDAIGKFYEPHLDQDDAKLTLYFIGYADYRGSDEYNEQLSLDRAGAVNDYIRNYGKFKTAKNCRFLLDGKGESESYQPTFQVNRGPKSNILNILQLDRRVEVCSDLSFEQDWRVTVTGREIWDQQLVKGIVVKKNIILKDVKWIYVYDGIEVHYTYVVDFSAARDKPSDPWSYKEGKITMVISDIVNNIKEENDYIRRSNLAKDIKGVVYANPNWEQALNGLSIKGTLVDDPDVKRLYQPSRSVYPPSSVPKNTDKQFRWIGSGDDVAYELSKGQSAGGFENIPHFQLNWPAGMMMPLMYAQFKDGTGPMEVGGKDGMSIWAEHLSSQWIPLKEGSRQFEFISTHPLHNPEHTTQPFMTIYYEQSVEKL